MRELADSMVEIQGLQALRTQRETPRKGDRVARVQCVRLCPSRCAAEPGSSDDQRSAGPQPGRVVVTNPWIPDPSQGVDKTITISGESTTVPKRPGIQVIAETNGFSERDKLNVWIGCSGETGNSRVAPRPVVRVDGLVTYQRKTGNKINAFFGSKEANVKSNRVIIPAR